ncbi:MAG: hypothetical protein ACXWGX_08235 [Usitatibacter sp.]
MTKATVAIAALSMLTLGMTLGAPARAQEEKGMKAHILIMEKPEELRKWMNRKPADRGGDSGRLRSVHAGKKIFFPIIATGIEAPGAGKTTQIFADLELLAPNGKIVANAKKCCSAVIRGATETAFSLGPVVDVELEPDDPTGTYKVKVRVTDGTQTVAAEETFQYEGPAAKAAPGPAASKPETAPEKSSAPPASRDIAPQAPRKAPGKNRDVSHCLSLPTPAEIIKCTEKAP